MRSGIIAQKVGMTRIFTDAGEHVPVTVLKVDHCQVVAHRTVEKNGYTAVQLGIGKAKVKNVSRAERGHFAVAKVEPKRKVAEFRVAPDGLILTNSHVAGSAGAGGNASGEDSGGVTGSSPVVAAAAPAAPAVAGSSVRSSPLPIASFTRSRKP